MSQQLEASLPEDTSLAGMNALIKSIGDMRTMKEEISEKLSEVNTEIQKLEQRAIDILMANELTGFKGPEGAISVKHHFTAKLPAGEAKQVFFDYLKSIGKFDELASIHSQTFNSYVKEQYDLAQEAGQPEPTLPGVSDVKTRLSLSFKRG